MCRYRAVRFSLTAQDDVPKGVPLPVARSDVKAPSSSGQDAALSRLKHGFDSRRGHHRPLPDGFSGEHPPSPPRKGTRLFHRTTILPVMPKALCMKWVQRSL